MEKEKANLITKKFLELNRSLNMEACLQQENVLMETKVHPSTFCRWRSGNSMPSIRDCETIALIATNCNEIMRLKNLKEKIGQMLKLLCDGEELES